MSGLGAGRQSAIASGAGHGGAGGRSSSQPLVGKAYGSFDLPLSIGSGGGRGHQDLVRLSFFSIPVERERKLRAYYNRCSCSCYCLVISMLNRPFPS